MNVAREELIDVSTPIPLKLGAPVPHAPVMVDYHVLPEPVVSERLKAVLEPMDLFMVQLVPAEVDVNGTRLSYWLLHVRNSIECLDMKRTQCRRSRRGAITILEKIVLDEKKLEEIPEEKRLLFHPREYGTIWLVHDKLKAVIEAVNPVGLRFFHTRDWSDAAAFR
ncbi:MAG TPA: DUF1629 domain-containing protein [Anaeromyxobacter sp.]|nr:DUF1629 domain-containing protein [Anaeromyxobacter sp.]